MPDEIETMPIWQQVVVAFIGCVGLLALTNYFWG